MQYALLFFVLMFAKTPPGESLSPQQRMHRSAVELARSIVDSIVEHSRCDSTPSSILDIEEWAGFLEASSHGLPPDIVILAFRNRTDYFELIAREEPLGREVFERTWRIMFACHDRAWRDWKEIDARAPDRLPDMPDFALRLGGAMVGGRATASPPEFQDEEERLAYEAWEAEDAEARMLMNRKHKLGARLRRVEQGFRSMSRNLYFHSNDQMRIVLIDRLTQASKDSEVNYLKLARLPAPPDADSSED